MRVDPIFEPLSGKLLRIVGPLGYSRGPMGDSEQIIGVTLRNSRGFS